MFNGQGAHFEGMGQDFASQYQEAATVYDEAESMTGYPIRQWITEDTSALKLTKHAQVAISATSLAIYRVIETQLPLFAAMAGLSLGEYSAFIASGYLKQHDAWPLLKIRGEMMSQQSQQLKNAQMLAVIGMPEETIAALINQLALAEQLFIANYNSPEQIVIGGNTEAIEAFKVAAKSQGFKKLVPLKVEGPFHTPLMKDIQAAYQTALSSVAFHFSESEKKPTIWSNVTAQPHQPIAVKDNLVRHLIEPVKWSQIIKEWYQAGITHVIQIGPGNTLAKLLKQQYPTLPCLVINQVADIDNIAPFIEKV